MSDMLKEKFEEFVTESGLVVESGDPMPTVSASVIPGGGSYNASGQSSTEVNSKGGTADSKGTVGTDAVNGYGAQQSVTDNHVRMETMRARIILALKHRLLLVLKEHRVMVLHKHLASMMLVIKARLLLLVQMQHMLHLLVLMYLTLSNLPSSHST